MKNKNQIKIIAILFLLSIPFYIFCLLNHTCRAGHMHHPPYPVLHHINDFLWIFSYVACLILSIITKAKRMPWFLIGSALLLIFRLYKGVGGDIIYEAPIIMYLTILSIKILIKPSKYIIENNK